MLRCIRDMVKKSVNVLILSNYAETCIVLHGKCKRGVCVRVRLMFRGVVQQKGPRVQLCAGRSVTFHVRDTVEQRGV